MYYSVITAYEVNGILTLESFKLGLPFNVIVDERNFTYRYYYEK